MEEVSREITLKAQKRGIHQIFFEDPIWFSTQLLAQRKEQFCDAESMDSDLVFFDRGLPDVVAYLDYIDCDYPYKFTDECQNYRYDKVFILEPWEAIYTQDNERYESFKQAVKIQNYLIKWYHKFNYELLTVPQESVENRVIYILENC